MSVTITFPDGSERSYDSGVTGAEIAASIGPRLAKAAVAVRLDGVATDLNRAITQDGTVEIVTENTEDGRHVLRHSAAHVMAQAVLAPG